MADANAPVELMVCTTCRAGQPTDVEGPRPGARLFEALQASDLPEHVTLTPVECFSNCDFGCSITLRGGEGRWTYVYGNFTGADDVALVAEGASKYAATADGLVPWRERSIHFRKNCIARIPPLEAPDV
ncbi:DUF1636 domain-containing protein [uncultured Shimia sp.]|uniref:DUF1636 domain-containing protein n=1 Tax=uncultured Shimia sp. TaxID=573152 RepID=UPI002615FDAD|nr:DUF1636 domain-containing protein [uncultured Shimia sp.]